MVANDKVEAKKLLKSYFDVLGICCPSEMPLIEGILKPLDGVKDVSVNATTKTVIVVHDSLLISQAQIVKALNQARLEANVRLYGQKNYQQKWPSPFVIVCGTLLLLSFLKYFWIPFKWLAVGAVGVGIYPIALKGFAALQNFRLDINTLVLIAVGGSIALNDYWEAATIVFLFAIAEWLQSRASHKAKAVTESLVNMVPQRAILAETGDEVDASEVQVNTILAVKAGDIIPIDGVVVEGQSEVDEKTLTGESFLVAKQIESPVWAGTINLNGYISVKTTALAEECVVARMAELVEEAQNNKSRTQRFIDKFASYYTPAIVMLSACLGLVPLACGAHNKKEWFHLALVVLVSACPCALVLSTPVAAFCALSKAATAGLLVKGADYLETLAKIKIMAFDKTGTITRGEFAVTEFQSLLHDVSLDTLLYWVSSIENKSSHPMAAAFVEYGQSHNVELKPDRVEEFQNFPGEGIYGKIDGKDIYIGNRNIAIRAGCEKVPSLEGDSREGKSTGYIILGSTLGGIFSLADICRTGVQEAIRELKSMGIKTAMLTGDCQAAAKHAQDQLGGALGVVHAELLPDDKARIIRDFQKEAPTAMIGDGLNDAPALATADIGISMGVSGSALATETGDVILMSNDIRKIPNAVRLARKAHTKIIQNMVLSIITKGAIVGLAIAGHPFVWAAVLADVGTCLLVIFNSMLLLQGTERFGRRHSQSPPHVHKHDCRSEHSNSCRGKSEHSHSCRGKFEHSHSCRGKFEHSHSSRGHQHHCLGKEAPKQCKLQKCSSNNCALADKKCLDIAEELKSQDIQNHEDQSMSSLKQGDDAISHTQCSLNHCPNNHRRGDATDEEQGNVPKTCSKSYPADMETYYQCKKEAVPHHSTINILPSTKHVHCRGVEACRSLERRHMGGCCESYRKECCINQTPDTKFKPCLSEIVID